MKIHELQQGTPEWHAFRLTHHGASEAAAMLGLSKKTPRNELLRMKKTGTPKEFSDWVQVNILDHGHEVEALARPLIEKIIGEDLYPVTCSNDDEGGHLSASCDGLTLLETRVFEHKQWNAELAESVRAGILPEEHQPQCQQILMVTKAEDLIFVVSDGTPERLVHMVVRPDQAWFDRIRAGWEQFDRDLAEYEVPAAAPVVTATPQEALPALSVRIDGTLAVKSNLDAFGIALRTYVDRIPKEPETDQDFADTEAACKRLKEVEEALGATENSALASLDDVEQMRRAVATLRELARTTRLAGERVVKTKKDEIRTRKVEAARRKFTEHAAALQAEIIGVKLSAQMPDFSGAIKGLRTLASLDNALDTTLANAKIELNELAADIRAKLTWFGDNVAQDLRGLFRDLNDLVTMAPEYFQQAVVARVQQHQQAENARLEAERERIRQEEAAKLAAQQQAAAAPAQPASSLASPLTSPRGPMAPEPAPAAARPASAPTLKLGQIIDRIAPLSITVDGLASLGFPHAATDKNAKLYHEADFPAICDALIEHITAARRGASELLAA